MSSSSDEDDITLDNLDDILENNGIDYYGSNVVLNGLRSITTIANLVIPVFLKAEEHLQERTRKVCNRQREEAHDRIYADYFAEDAKYPLSYFRRRFRMRRPLFLQILNAIESYDPYFTQRFDCTGKRGLSALQKMTAAIKMLATGCSADNLDEYVQIGESTTIESLNHFCTAIIDIYEKEYMRRPNEHDIARLLAQGEARGFPGMLGSLDCMHWVN